jgi:ribonuclease HII
MMKLPNFSFEKRLWRRGFEFVAGADEVGRGCFAGPVVAAAVAFAPISNSQLVISNDKQRIRINDSKKLTPRQREKADRWIRKNALAWGIGQASVSEINRLGIGKATQVAFRRAVKQAKDSLSLRAKRSNLKPKKGLAEDAEPKQINFLLIDAFYIPYVQNLFMPAKKARKRKKIDFVTLLRNSVTRTAGRQLAIVHGDEKSFSIAAASIIAKVYRDKVMVSLSKQPKYKKYGWGRNKGYGTREHQKAIKKWGITRLHRKKFIETFFGGIQRVA